MIRRTSSAVSRLALASGQQVGMELIRSGKRAALGKVESVMDFLLHFLLDSAPLVVAQLGGDDGQGIGCQPGIELGDAAVSGRVILARPYVLLPAITVTLEQHRRRLVGS